MQSYHTKRDKPLNQEEIEEKCEEVQEEMQEVLIWKKEEEDKLKKDKFKTHQAKSACLRNIKKVARRIDSVNGMIDYWNNREKGMTPFRASIELNEYWAELKEKAKVKEEAELAPKGVPSILRSEGKKKQKKNCQGC